MIKDSWDPQGKAFTDYMAGLRDIKLLIKSDEGDWEIPVEIYFRDLDSFPEHEFYALELCRGKILDIGAGTGCHALALQEFGKNVTAIDISPVCVEVMKKQGVREAVASDFFQFEQKGFDTLLLLMNGIGFVKSLAGLKRFFARANDMLNPGGQIIFDSTDLRIELPGKIIADVRGKFFGTVSYQLQYGHLIGKPFRWLFIDQDRLEIESRKMGWKMQVVYQDEDGMYLARLTRLE